MSGREIYETIAKDGTTSSDSTGSAPINNQFRGSTSSSRKRSRHHISQEASLTESVSGPPTRISTEIGGARTRVINDVEQLSDPILLGRHQQRGLQRRRAEYTGRRTTTPASHDDDMNTTSFDRLLELQQMQQHRSAPPNIKLNRLESRGQNYPPTSYSSSITLGGDTQFSCTPFSASLYDQQQMHTIFEGLRHRSSSLDDRVPFPLAISLLGGASQRPAPTVIASIVHSGGLGQRGRIPSSREEGGVAFSSLQRHAASIAASRQPGFQTVVHHQSDGGIISSLAFQQLIAQRTLSAPSPNQSNILREAPSSELLHSGHIAHGGSLLSGESADLGVMMALLASQGESPPNQIPISTTANDSMQRTLYYEELLRSRPLNLSSSGACSSLNASRMQEHLMRPAAPALLQFPFFRPMDYSISQPHLGDTGRALYELQRSILQQPPVNVESDRVGGSMQHDGPLSSGNGAQKDFWSQSKDASSAFAGASSKNSGAFGPLGDAFMDDISPAKKISNVYPIDLPVFLVLPNEDTLHLSRHQVFLRQQIEVFRASKQDVSTHQRGRNKPVLVGQIGIRCRYCAHVPVGTRQKGSTYFPATLDGLYQAAQNMSTMHLQCGLCSEMPDLVRQQFVYLISTKTASSGAGLPYWSKAASKLGLVNTDNVIRFIRDLKPEKEPPPLASAH